MTGAGVAPPDAIETLSPLSLARMELWAARQVGQLAELREVLATHRWEAEELERSPQEPAGKREELVDLVDLVDAALTAAVAAFDDAIQATASAATARVSDAARQARWELVEAGAPAEEVELPVSEIAVPALRRPRSVAELIAAPSVQTHSSHSSSNPESEQ